MKTAQRHVALLILPVLCYCLVLTVAGGNVQAADAVHPMPVGGMARKP